MRLTVIAATVLLLAACREKPAAREETGVQDDVGALAVSGNDVTAIDAATGDDANMAADSEVLLNDLNSTIDANVGDAAANTE